MELWWTEKVSPSRGCTLTGNGVMSRHCLTSFVVMKISQPQLSLRGANLWFARLLQLFAFANSTGKLKKV
jgi:hypothetical protein